MFWLWFSLPWCQCFNKKPKRLKKLEKLKRPFRHFQHFRPFKHFFMNWKRFLSYKHHNLSAHHHYQIGAIFLFFFGFFLFFPFYMLVQELNLDILDWQWYFFWPWLIFYVVYCLQMRSKIPPNELRSPLLRPIGHWVLLGITTLMLYLQPAPLHSLRTIDIAFLVLSVFVADGYWDFRKIMK